MREYIIHYANQPRWTDYMVDAKDAFDARVFGEVWGKRWKMEMESMKELPHKGGM